MLNIKIFSLLFFTYKNCLYVCVNKINKKIMNNIKFDTIKSLKELIKDLPDDMEVLTYHENIDSENGTPIYQFEIDEKNNTLTIY